MVLSISGCWGDGNSGGFSSQEDGVFYRPKAIALQADAAGEAVRLFVVNDDDSLTSCGLQPDGSMAACSNRKNPHLAAVNHVAIHPGTQTLLFDQAAGASLTSCALDAGLGLAACQPSTDGGAIQDARSVAFNASGRQAYVVLADSRVVRCAVAGNGVLQSCATVPLPGGLGRPATLRLLATASGEYAYLLNSGGDASISVCTVSPSTGNFERCVAERGNGVFTAPSSMTFNPARSHAYIANADTNSIAICGVSATGGLVSCRNSDGEGTFAAVSALSFDPAGKRAYAANALNSTISVCTVASQGGDLNACSVFTIEDFEYTTDMVIGTRQGGLIAYIVSFSNGAVYGCPLDKAGEFTSCASTE
ncbi:lactonase family protein [Variovorax terrae]|uniref:Lactonase family protein n=1 Tax=Variovorax terrae TaxID=2923278 RepID=A0A9X2ALH1_9BURK|nr:lactonase family protein [Variovorax terrae]MCJ0762693.1 lactonase family protein [Variovorax terrae]